jgi:hypothetical protein
VNDRGQLPLLQHERLVHAPAIHVGPNHRAAVVDVEQASELRARHLDRGDLAARTPNEPTCLAGHDVTGDADGRAPIVDAGQDGGGTGGDVNPGVAPLAAAEEAAGVERVKLRR